MVTHLGWREACLAYAAVQLGFSLPIYMSGLPREPVGAASAVPAPPAAEPRPMAAPAPGLLPLMAAAITIASFVSALLSVHLLTVLQGKGLALASAVALGALVGPSQVGARAVELAIAARHHPIWTKLAATSLVALGVAALWAGGSLLTPALLLYGAGVGLESIARGTLPLAVVGREAYPVVMGRIALPSLLAQAGAPLAGSLLLDGTGANGTLVVLIAVARPQRAAVGRSMRGRTRVVAIVRCGYARGVPLGSSLPVPFVGGGSG